MIGIIYAKAQAKTKIEPYDAYNGHAVTREGSEKVYTVRRGFAKGSDIFFELEPGRIIVPASVCREVEAAKA